VKRLFALYKKYSALLLTLLKPLGFWGIGLLAILDTSSIPVPMDAFIAFYAWNDAHRFYLYVIMAAVGSAIGGLVPYFIGRAGGEIFLLKHVNRLKYESLRDRFEKQEFLALMIPSALPPPTPWKVFVFCAGVFEMRTLNFMFAVFCGRLIRFGIESLLVIRYGPQIIHEITVITKRHSIAGLIVLCIVLAGIAYYVIRKSKGKRVVDSA
jgi:membrane protein YqaA with SNARE-associated domain